MKRHVKSLHKVSDVDQYLVQNLTCSVVYLRSTLSNNLLQKVLTLVTLTVTIPEFFVVTMTTLPYNSYDDLGETLTHMNSLKIKKIPEENVIDFCTAILVYAELL